MKKSITLFILLLFSTTLCHAGECKEFIELHSLKNLAYEWERSEWWVVNNVKINLWKKPFTPSLGTTGILLPGSRALIIKKFKGLI